MPGSKADSDQANSRAHYTSIAGFEISFERMGTAIKSLVRLTPWIRETLVNSA
jgi:hypothetical protein